MVEEAEASGLLIPGVSVLVEPSAFSVPLRCIDAKLTVFSFPADSVWQHRYRTGAHRRAEGVQMYHRDGVLPSFLFKREEE